jgi:predicted DNA-binding transcriptional regulator AlpA
MPTLTRYRPGVILVEKTTIEPLVGVEGLAKILSVSRRTIERQRSAGNFPRPDLYIGKMPRWQPETVRRWIAAGGKAA